MLLLPLALAACVSSRGAPPAATQAKAVPSGNEAVAVPPATESAPEQPGALQSVGESAGRIATQPVKDVGVAKTKFPPVLLTEVTFQAMFEQQQQQAGNGASANA